MQFIGVNENIKHASERFNTKDLDNKLVSVLGAEHVWLNLVGTFPASEDFWPNCKFAGMHIVIVSLCLGPVICLINKA